MWLQQGQNLPRVREDRLELSDHTLGRYSGEETSPVLQPRALTLRLNGPSPNSGVPFNRPPSKMPFPADARATDHTSIEGLARDRHEPKGCQAVKRLLPEAKSVDHLSRR